MTALRRWWCAFLGHHHLLLVFEPHRLALRCAECGYESPGWPVEGHASAVTDEAAA